MALNKSSDFKSFNDPTVWLDDFVNGRKQTKSFNSNLNSFSSIFCSANFDNRIPITSQIRLTSKMFWPVLHSTKYFRHFRSLMSRVGNSFSMSIIIFLDSTIERPEDFITKKDFTLLAAISVSNKSMSATTLS
eukprot:NODE_3_length_80033_cov_0.932970.p63 type:complete len:133 gc:universal NODE_3_length_80033_cov_0.932970:64966-65364(+)